MNILFYICRYPGYGGIEKVTTVLANYFVENNNWNVYVLSHLQQDIQELYDQIDKRVHILKMPNKANDNSIENQNYLNDNLKTNNIDVIIYQDSYSTYKLLFTISTDVKIIIVEHNTPDYQLKSLNFFDGNFSIHYLKIFLKYPYQYYKTVYALKKRHRLLYDLCDKYILLSNRYLPIFKRVSKITKANKITVINNPLTIKNSYNNSSKQNICLFVGRLEPQKGIVNLMKIWNKIEKIDKPDWELIIVGDGSLRQDIEQFIERNQLKKVKLLGYKADVSEFMMRAKIFLMTSIFEGWALTLIESMSQYCIPIVFDSFDAIYEIIDNGINGYIIPSFDLKNYINTILKLMNSSVEELNIMGIKAYQKSQKFKIEYINEDWKKLFSEI